MSWFGTDLVALGCIVSGAVVGGAATYAVMDGTHDGNRACALTTRAVAPTVTVSRSGETRAVVVRPHVRVKSNAHCADVVEGLVEIRLNRHLEGLDAQLQGLERTLELELSGLEGKIEAEARQQAEFQIQRAEAQIQAAQARMQGADGHLLQMEEALRQMERARIRVRAEKNREGGS